MKVKFDPKRKPWGPSWAELTRISVRSVMSRCWISVGTEDEARDVIFTMVELHFKWRGVKDVKELSRVIGTITRMYMRDHGQIWKPN